MIEISAATPEEEKELVDLFEIVFGVHDRDVWQRFHGREPFYQSHWSKVVRDNGQIVSHVCWLPRAMRIGAAVVRAGVVGYVATHPAHRRQGLAATLMNSWTDELTARGEHLSFVSGIPNFYEKFGYEFAFPADDCDAPVWIDIKDLPSDPGVLRLRRCEREDLPILADLHDEENDVRTGSLVRTTEYWRWLFDGLQASGKVTADDLWLAQRPGSEPVGYVMFHLAPNEQVDIWEAAAANDTVANALLVAAAAKARAIGSLRINLQLPLNHRVVRTAVERRAHLSGYSYGIYARILNVEGLLAALAPEFERRLRNSPHADWRGTLKFLTDIGTVEVALSRGEVRIGEKVEPCQTLDVPQALLIKLITGYSDVRLVAGLVNGRFHAGLATADICSTHWPVLQTLFPKGWPYVWNGDAGY